MGRGTLVAGTENSREETEMQSLVQKPAGAVVPGLCAAAVALIVGITAPQAQADEADAKRLLKAMSDYMAAQKAISFDFDTNFEIVTTDLQKLALASSGAMTVNRPDKVRATRSGGFAEVELVFDGKTLTLLGKTANLYGQVEAPGTIDHLIGELREKYGRPVPGADLLESNVYDALMSSAVDLKDLGSGVIHGIECDHLAARTDEVDWQIWIAQGDRPHPCRYVITTKMMTGSPQYTVDITNWKAGTEVAAVDFAFKNSTNAKKMDLKDLPDTDELPGIFAVGGVK
jgi:hypothetical protein